MAKTILLAAQRPSDYVEMKRCALALAERGHTIQFIYHPTYGGSDLDNEILRDMEANEKTGSFSRTMVALEAGAPKLLGGGASGARPTLAKKEIEWWKRTMLGRMLHPAVVKALRIASAVRVVIVTSINYLLVGIFLASIYPRRLRSYIAILKEFRPDIIILPEDVVGLVTPLLIKAGHINDIPSLVVPYTIANQQEAFQSLRQYPSLSYYRWYNWIVAVFLPSWVMRQDGQAVIRLPVAHIIGHVLTRSSPPDPWMMNSGYANAIAIENKSMYDYYLAAGIPASKMRVVGAVYDDALAQRLLNKEAELASLRAELAIDNARPLLVIGGCPDQSGSCPAFEFADMREFAGKLAEAVASLSDDYQIIVRPHPNYPDLGEMLRERGLLVTMIDTARLVALSDAYIAFGSATIRWAVSCGVPTINYDVFRYNYSDFKAVSSVQTVASHDEFLRALALLRLGSTELQSLRERAVAEAPRWGTLDGHSVARIEGLIDELCAVKPVPRTAA